MKNLIKRIEVENLFGYHSYSLNFDNPVSIIFGTNGLGKTTILKIIETLFNSNQNLNELFNIVFTKIKIFFTNNNGLIVGKKDNKILIDYIYNDKIYSNLEFEKDNIFIENHINNIKKLFTQASNLNKTSFIEELTKMNSNDNNYILFKQYFESFYMDYDPSWKKVTINEDYGCCVKNSNNKFLPFSALSSGEKNLGSILYYLLFKTSDETIVLIDEPETSLHVAWQEQLTETIIEIANKKNIQIIMATHSPFMSSGHDDLLVEGELLDN